VCESKDQHKKETTKQQVKKNTFFSLLLMGSLLSIGSANAQNGIPNYVPMKPLTEVVKTPVGEVKTDNPTQVPIITWGGDEATIFANGNMLLTAEGSLFKNEGLNIKLVREDVFVKQVEKFVSGESPYLRGTLGQITAASEILSRDPRTTPVVIKQLTWSTGGDCIVVKSSIKTAADFKGKTIALQAYAPEMEYLTTVLASAGLTVKDVNLKFTRDLTGTSETPTEAFRNDQSVDAAIVISPDAAALSGKGEGAVKGARTLLTTKVANRIIADVYVVRSDYFKAHRPEVEKFVHALLLAQEGVQQLVKDQSSNKTGYDAFMKASAKILLDSETAVADAEGLYADCEFVGFAGNVKFFGSTDNRRFSVLTSEIATGFAGGLNLLSGPVSLAAAGFDYDKLKAGIINVQVAEAPKFDEQKVKQMIGQASDQGTLSNQEIVSFQILFKPNQNSFSPEIYEADFKRAVQLAATYGGAVITVEGNSDPLNYVKKRDAGAPANVLNGIKQAAKNLSLTRALAVRDGIIAYAKNQNMSLDPSQFTTIGHGIMNPAKGLVNNEPQAPATQDEWLSNMRVVFRIIAVEAEAEVFTPSK
jgi:outer membrane protein OmpA-like peptidoglycan-associated protein